MVPQSSSVANGSKAMEWCVVRTCPLNTMPKFLVIVFLVVVIKSVDHANFIPILLLKLDTTFGCSDLLYFLKLKLRILRYCSKNCNYPIASVPHPYLPAN